MKQITPDALASIQFDMHWSHGGIAHTDAYVAKAVNFWRDWLPDSVHSALQGLRAGDVVQPEVDSTTAVAPYRPEQINTLHARQFRGRRGDNQPLTPRYGRFYPRGMIGDMAGIFRDNMQPFRFLDGDEKAFKADFNHPLAGRPLELTARVHKVFDKIDERGGTANAWFEIMANGPGMQARANGRETDFFSESPFVRADEAPDRVFYDSPRMVNHLDSRARGRITDLYASLIPKGSRVLDLMGSWNSHLPHDRRFARVTGLGMNPEELAANPQLTDSIVHDLNATPVLPLDDNTCDAVVCTASVEYLTAPFDVFRDVARVLKDDGVFVVTFSNRWFSPKAIRIWPELHEFERLGLVTEYFLASGLYDRIETYSLRGLPRPEDDKYYGQYPESDPVFAVWGRKKR
ncbi:MAG: methyltransferase domain-containing protein [Thermodesulfobacteriota bacterium]|nr:methyltransferase domain-containing protein [Thermodesulfobacteriota bacterium]